MRPDQVTFPPQFVYEHELGDFGMGGMCVRRAGCTIPSSTFNEPLFVEGGIDWVTRPHVRRGEPGCLVHQDLAAKEHEEPFDLAIVPHLFSGVGLRAVDRDGTDVTDRMLQPGRLMKVDANHESKPYERWSPDDWPRTYQSPPYPNVFAAGSALAPPHAISRPRTTPTGTPISPAPPHTGMPPAEIGRPVAQHRRHDRPEPRPNRDGVDGRDGRRLRGLGRGQPVHRDGCVHDGAPDRSRPRPPPSPRPGPEPDLRRDRPRRALGQDPPPPPVPLQGPAPPRLAPHPAVTALANRAPHARHHAASDPYASTPTRAAVLLRTFLPWQVWPFVWTDLKMLGIVRRRPHGARAPSRSPRDP